MGTKPTCCTSRCYSKPVWILIMKMPDGTVALTCANHKTHAVKYFEQAGYTVQLDRFKPAEFKHG